MYYRDSTEIRKARGKAFERAGKIWAGCGIAWFLFAMSVKDVPVIGFLAYWGIYVGGVVATVLLFLAFLRISRSAEQQINEIKDNGGF